MASMLGWFAIPSSSGWKEYTEELYKKMLMSWITMMVWSVTQSQTLWSVKSSVP